MPPPEDTAPRDLRQALDGPAYTYELKLMPAVPCIWQRYLWPHEPLGPLGTLPETEVRQLPDGSLEFDITTDGAKLRYASTDEGETWGEGVAVAESRLDKAADVLAVYRAAIADGPLEYEAGLVEGAPVLSLNEQAANEALTDALFTEAARRITKQDAATTALKKLRAKRKRKKKLAKARSRGKR